MKSRVPQEIIDAGSAMVRQPISRIWANVSGALIDAEDFAFGRFVKDGGVGAEAGFLYGPTDEEGTSYGNSTSHGIIDYECLPDGSLMLLGCYEKSPYEWYGRLKHITDPGDAEQWNWAGATDIELDNAVSPLSVMLNYHSTGVGRAIFSGVAGSFSNCGTNGPVYAMCQVGDIIYLAGSITRAGASYSNSGVFGYDPTAEEPYFGLPSSSAFIDMTAIYALAASSDGRYLYVGGKFKVNIKGRVYENLVRYDLSTSVWEEVGSAELTTDPPNSVVYALCVDPVNKLMIGGHFNLVRTYLGGVRQDFYIRNVAGWRPSDKRFEQIGLSVGLQDTNGPVLSITAGPVPYYFFTGEFTTLGSSDIYYVYMYSPVFNNFMSAGDLSGVSGIEGVTAITSSGSTRYCGVKLDTGEDAVYVYGGDSWSLMAATNGRIHGIKHKSGNVYVWGTFTEVGGVSTGNVAVYSGGAWSAVHLVEEAVYELCFDTDTSFYVGGDFSITSPSSYNNFFYWDGTGPEYLCSLNNRHVEVPFSDYGASLGEAIVYNPNLALDDHGQRYYLLSKIKAGVRCAYSGFPYLPDNDRIYAVSRDYPYVLVRFSSDYLDNAYTRGEEKGHFPLQINNNPSFDGVRLGDGSLLLLAVGRSTVESTTSPRKIYAYSYHNEELTPIPSPFVGELSLNEQDNTFIDYETVHITRDLNYGSQLLFVTGKASFGTFTYQDAEGEDNNVVYYLYYSWDDGRTWSRPIWYKTLSNGARATATTIGEHPILFNKTLLTYGGSSHGEYDEVAQPGPWYIMKCDLTGHDWLLDDLEELVAEDVISWTLNCPGVRNVSALDLEVHNVNGKYNGSPVYALNTKLLLQAGYRFSGGGSAVSRFMDSFKAVGDPLNLMVPVEDDASQVFDQSGHERHWSKVGAPLLNAASNGLRYVQFDGASRLEIANAAWQTPADGTIVAAFWFDYYHGDTLLSGVEHVYSKGVATASPYDYFFCRFLTGRCNATAFSLANGTASWGQVQTLWGISGTQEYIPNTIIPYGGWHLIISRWTAGGKHVAILDDQLRTSSGTVTAVNNAVDLLLGWGLYGKLAAFALYDEALSDDDVLILQAAWSDYRLSDHVNDDAVDYYVDVGKYRINNIQSEVSEEGQTLRIEATDFLSYAKTTQTEQELHWMSQLRYSARINEEED